jgi:hypothetical protein
MVDIVISKQLDALEILLNIYQYMWCYQQDENSLNVMLALIWDNLMD